MKPSQIIDGCKVCSKCGVSKKLTDYHKDSRLTHGTKHLCKSCNKQAAASYWVDHPIARAAVQKRDYQKNRERRLPKTVVQRRTRLLRKYGLTQEVFEDLLSKQNGCCAICKTPFCGKTPCIDHSHVTGKRRGLLCPICNIRLAVVEDALFTQAGLAYLAEHN